MKAIGTITKNRSELVWKSLARNSVVAVAAFHRITCPHPYAVVGSLVSSIRVRQSSYFTVHFWKKRQYNFILLGEDLLVAIFLFTCDASCLHNWVNLFSVFPVTPMIGIHCCFFWFGRDVYLFSLINFHQKVFILGSRWPWLDFPWASVSDLCPAVSRFSVGFSAYCRLYSCRSSRQGTFYCRLYSCRSAEVVAREKVCNSLGPWLAGCPRWCF